MYKHSFRYGCKHGVDTLPPKPSIKHSGQATAWGLATLESKDLTLTIRVLPSTLAIEVEGSQEEGIKPYTQKR